MLFRSGRPLRTRPLAVYFLWPADHALFSSPDCDSVGAVPTGGPGKNAYVEGYRIGGKTATSQTLPRSANKYISSFVGFAPADDPEILGMCVIYDPQGIYYGGTIAAPVIGNIFENILPYLGIEKQLEMQYTR